MRRSNTDTRERQTRPPAQQRGGGDECEDAAAAAEEASVLRDLCKLRRYSRDVDLRCVASCF
jgi:hypothetical protein